MSIENLPGQKYRAVVRYAGKKRSGPTRTDRDEARQDEARLTLEMGADPKDFRSVYSVRALVNDQLQQGGYAASSIGPLRATAGHIPADLMAMKAEKVTTPLLNNFLEQMPTPEYRRKARNLISKAYRVAMVKGFVSHNPAAPIPSGQVTTAEVVPPSVQEVEALISAAREVNPAFGTFVRLAAHLGIRRGELVGLKWDDLTDSPAIRIRRSIATDERIVTPTKTGQRSHRTLAISESVHDELQGLPRVSEYIFSHGDGPWRPGYVSLAFGRLTDDYSLHSLRHFVATEMLGKGFSVADVAHRLGDSVATVSRVYIHHIPDRDRAAADALPV